jgi:hypothetical protein
LNRASVSSLPTSIPHFQVSVKTQVSGLKKIVPHKGHLKSTMLNTSQETWKLDLPDNLVAPAPGAQGQPQGPCTHVPITTSHIAPPFFATLSAPVRNNKKCAASTSVPPHEADDDFMPPMKQRSRGSGTTRMSDTSSFRASVDSAPIVFDVTFVHVIFFCCNYFVMVLTMLFHMISSLLCDVYLLYSTNFENYSPFLRVEKYKI